MLEMRKLDVVFIEGKCSKPKQEMIDKLRNYKKTRKQFKSIDEAIRSIELSKRTILRFHYVLRYGSKLTIDNILNGEITLNFAASQIKKVVDRQNIKIQQEREEEEKNGIPIVTDPTTGERVTIDYLKTRDAYFNQIKLAKSQNYKYFNKEVIKRNLLNMLTLIE